MQVSKKGQCANQGFILHPLGEGKCVSGDGPCVTEPRLQVHIPPGQAPVPYDVLAPVLDDAVVGWSAALHRAHMQLVSNGSPPHAQRLHMCSEAINSQRAHAATNLKILTCIETAYFQTEAKQSTSKKRPPQTDQKKGPCPKHSSLALSETLDF